MGPIPMNLFTTELGYPTVDTQFNDTFDSDSGYFEDILCNDELNEETGLILNNHEDSLGLTYSQACCGCSGGGYISLHEVFESSTSAGHIFHNDFSFSFVFRIFIFDTVDLIQLKYAHDPVDLQVKPFVTLKKEGETFLLLIYVNHNLVLQSSYLYRWNIIHFKSFWKKIN